MKNYYEIEGKYAYIHLKRRNGDLHITVVDVDMLPKLFKLNVTWYPFYNKRNDSFYARASIKGKPTFLHRYLLDAPSDMMVDHMNWDTLMNTMDNLRIVTNAQNMQNQQIRSDNSTGVRGVNFDNDKQKFRARVGINGKRIQVGYFKTLEEAEKAIIEARKELMPFSTN